jgi:hypothetical protein
MGWSVPHKFALDAVCGVSVRLFAWKVLLWTFQGPDCSKPMHQIIDRSQYTWKRICG